MSDVHLHFKGQKYSVEKLIALAASGPSLGIKPDEINLADSPRLDTGEVPSAPAGFEQVVFTKFEGKYLILRGYAVVERTIKDAPDKHVKGKLVSMTALKKARIETRPTFQPSTPSNAKPFNPVFADLKDELVKAVVVKKLAIPTQFRSKEEKKFYEELPKRFPDLNPTDRECIALQAEMIGQVAREPRQEGPRTSSGFPGHKDPTSGSPRSRSPYGRIARGEQH